MKKLHVNTNDKRAVINKNIYGHFSEHLGRCIYDGLFVGEDSPIPNKNGIRSDIVQALKNINIPVLRWPGGCFADEYHWKDGIGPKNKRKKMINTHWGGVVEDNSFGTHEFMDLCEQIGCEPYISGNVGSGTIQEMSEWVEYITFNGVSPMAELRKEHGKEDAWKIKYWGVGNENWGCGGNMRPEYYADLYRRFATYIRNYSGNNIYKIACGANAFDYNWTNKVMEIAGGHMNAITLHYYTIPTGDWGKKGSATDFNTLEYYRTLKAALKIEELVKNHIEIMNRHDPSGRVGLIVDEWGTWYDVEPGTNPGFLYQQNTMRDAIVAALSFNIFHHFSNRIVMTNIAQIVNVLQSIILTEGEKMILTPTYHVFDLYKGHHNATEVYTFHEKNNIGIDNDKITDFSASASIKENGNLFITIVNPSADSDLPVEICINEFETKKVTARILNNNINAYNRFDEPNNVIINDFNGITIDKNILRLNMPACSIIAVNLE